MAAAPAHAATAAFAGLAVPCVAPGSAPLRRPCKEGTERHSPLGTGTGAGDTAMRRVDGPCAGAESSQRGNETVVS